LGVGTRRFIKRGSSRISEFHSLRSESLLTHAGYVVTILMRGWIFTIGGMVRTKLGVTSVVRVMMMFTLPVHDQITIPGG
jgi:hypothetical protein